MRNPVGDISIKPDTDHQELPEVPDGPVSCLQYPHGVVKKTWAFGFDRNGNDAKLEEVLETTHSTDCNSVCFSVGRQIGFCLN